MRRIVPRFEPVNRAPRHTHHGFSAVKIYLGPVNKFLAPTETALNKRKLPMCRNLQCAVGMRSTAVNPGLNLFGEIVNHIWGLAMTLTQGRQTRAVASSIDAKAEPPPEVCAVCPRYTATQTHTNAHRRSSRRTHADTQTLPPSPRSLQTWALLPGYVLPGLDTLGRVSVAVRNRVVR